MKYFFDKYAWTEKVIDSCETIAHVETCKRLIDNLFQTYRNDFTSIAHEIFLLEMRLENKKFTLK